MIDCSLKPEANEEQKNQKDAEFILCSKLTDTTKAT